MYKDSLHDRLGATMLYVTHDQVEAMTLGERIAVMRDGRLQQYAPPLEIYRQPANLYVATFIGTPAINLAAGDVRMGAFTAGRLAMDAPSGIRDGGVVLGVRAENLHLVPAGDGAPHVAATVHRVERLGNESLVHLEGPLDRLRGRDRGPVPRAGRDRDLRRRLHRE